MSKIKQYHKYIYICAIALFFIFYLGYSVINSEVAIPHNPYEEKNENASKVTLNGKFKTVEKESSKNFSTDKSNDDESNLDKQESSKKAESNSANNEIKESPTSKSNKEKSALLNKKEKSESSTAEDDEATPPSEREESESSTAEDDEATPPSEPEESESSTAEDNEATPPSEPEESESSTAQDDEATPPSEEPEESESSTTQDKEEATNATEPEEPDSSPSQDKEASTAPESDTTPETDEPEDKVIGTASIKISAEKIGKGTLASNSAIDIKKNDNGANIVHRFLNENSISYDNSGSINSSFYLQRIYIQGINENVNISEELLTELESKNLDVDYDVYDVHSLGEFDYTINSGWVYSVNGVHMNYGFSDYTVEDGDQIYIRFTLDLF